MYLRMYNRVKPNQRYIICSIFFPEIAKAKMLFIYKDLMEKRITYTEELKKMAKKLYEADVLTRAEDPIYGWWSVFWIKRYRCLICKGKIRNN